MALRTILTGLLTMSLLAGPAPARAREDSGVQFPETMTLEGKPLKLSGMGLRKKFLFHVYVAGLYAETPSKDAAAFVQSDQVKRIVLSLQRDLTKNDIVGAIREGFDRNSKAQLGDLQARLDQLAAAIPDLKFKDQIALSYVPGSGVRVEVNGNERARIDGKDFADALFSVWFGRNPVDEWLKNRLLGG